MSKKTDKFLSFYKSWVKSSDILLLESYEGLLDETFKDYKKIIEDIQRNYNSNNELVYSITKKVTLDFENEEILYSNLRAFLRLKHEKITNESLEKAKTLTTENYSKWITEQNVDYITVNSNLIEKHIEQIEIILTSLKSLVEASK